MERRESRACEIFQFVNRPNQYANMIQLESRSANPPALKLTGLLPLQIRPAIAVALDRDRNDAADLDRGSIVGES